MADLDNILSGNSTAAPEAKEHEEVVTQVSEGEGQQEQPEAQGNEGEQGQKMVPHEALHAEKQKVKRYTEEVADFRKQLSETNAAWERRMAQLVEAVKPQQPQQQEADWFADPDAATQRKLGEALDPFQNKLSTIETQIMRLVAVQSHGADKVSAFEKYVAEAMDRGDPEMTALSAQMRASPDPIGTGLQWFEKRTFDPAAERERIKAELLAEMEKGDQQQAQQRPAPVMPSSFTGARNVGSRSGPAWGGPQPLQDIFDRTRPQG